MEHDTPRCTSYALRVCVVAYVVDIPTKRTRVRLGSCAAS